MVIPIPAAQQGYLSLALAWSGTASWSLMHYEALCRTKDVGVCAGDGMASQLSVWEGRAQPMTGFLRQRPSQAKCVLHHCTPWGNSGSGGLQGPTYLALCMPLRLSVSQRTALPMAASSLQVCGCRAGPAEKLAGADVAGPS